MKKLLFFIFIIINLQIIEIAASISTLADRNHALMRAKDLLKIVLSFKPFFPNISFKTEILENGNDYEKISSITDPYNPKPNIAFYIKKIIIATDNQDQELGKITYIVTNVQQRTIQNISWNPLFAQASLITTTLLCLALEDCAQWSAVYTPPVIVIECLDLFAESDPASFQSILYNSCRYDPHYPKKPDCGWIDFKTSEENLVKYYPLYKDQSKDLAH